MYGLRARPYSIGAQPKGSIEFIQPDDVSREIRKQFDASNFRHGILVYPSPLSEKEISSYELIDLNNPLGKQWDSFVEFATDMVENEIEFDEFIADFVHPRGSMRKNNPLHLMKPVDFFKLLSKNGFPGNMMGLKKFYNQL
jgi:hypothetical protein